MGGRQEGRGSKRVGWRTRVIDEVRVELVVVVVVWSDGELGRKKRRVEWVVGTEKESRTSRWTDEERGWE